MGKLKARIYRVHVVGDNGDSLGFKAFTSRRNAEDYERELAKIMKTAPGFETIELGPGDCPRTAVDVLNRYGSHPDNG